MISCTHGRKVIPLPHVGRGRAAHDAVLWWRLPAEHRPGRIGGIGNQEGAIPIEDRANLRLDRLIVDLAADRINNTEHDA